ncbi:MAG: hypothetical protein IJ209_06175 [Bacteroidaceae bacterium]|nr:hypothetical protein [Bacteroidaceae bacterium]
MKKMKKAIIATLLALVAMAGQAQKHLPAFQYSGEPAVLSGTIIGEAPQKPDSVRVRYALKYSSGMGDAIRRASAAVDADGSIHHAFKGRGGLDHMMKELSPVLQ